MGGERVGVISAEDLLRAFVRIFHHVGQCLHGIPHWLRRHLEGELIMLKRRGCIFQQLVKRVAFLAVSAHPQRQGFRDQHAIRQHHQCGLFAIGEVVCLCQHFVSDGSYSCGNAQVPTERGVQSFADFERLLNAFAARACFLLQ